MGSHYIADCAAWIGTPKLRHCLNSRLFDIVLVDLLKNLFGIIKCLDIDYE